MKASNGLQKAQSGLQKASPTIHRIRKISDAIGGVVRSDVGRLIPGANYINLATRAIGKIDDVTQRLI